MKKILCAFCWLQLNEYGTVLTGYSFYSFQNVKDFMANLDVQPKKQGSIVPWILLAIGVLATILLLARGCDGGDHDDTRDATHDSVSAATPAHDNATTTTTWDDVDFNGPAVRYEEITNDDINVRGNDRYAVYGIGEEILFDKGKADIRSAAEANLQQIAGSLNKRYGSGDVRVFGFTDSQGDAAANKELAQRRADAVRNWLSSKGNVTENKISIHPIGEGAPAASNATEQGQQKNRRVEIVARNAH